MMLFELDFARKDMALESSSNSSSLGFSVSGGSLMSGGIGSATVSASYHDSNEVKSALSGFDEAAERANVESAGGSYDISRVKEEKHSSGFDFSVDAIGLAGMMGGGGGNSSTFSVPLEVSIEKDGDKSTFFMTSGNMQDAVLETADNFVSAAKDMSAFGTQFMQNPGDTTAKLLNPLKGLVDEISDRAFGKQPSKPEFVSTVDSDGEEYEDIVIEEFEKPAVKSAAKASAVETEEDDAELAGIFGVVADYGAHQEQDAAALSPNSQFLKDFDEAKDLIAQNCGEELANELFDPKLNEAFRISLLPSWQKEGAAFVSGYMDKAQMARGRPFTPNSLKVATGEARDAYQSYCSKVMNSQFMERKLEAFEAVFSILDAPVKAAGMMGAADTFAAGQELELPFEDTLKAAKVSQENIEKYLGLALIAGSIKNVGFSRLKSLALSTKDALKSLKISGKAKVSVKPGTVSVEVEAANKGVYDARKWDAHLQDTHPGASIETHTLPGMHEKNVKLAGQGHPVSNVVFDQRGYPIFDDITVYQMKLTKPGSTEFMSGAEMAQFRSREHQQMATQMMRDEWAAGRITRNDLMQMEIKRIESLERYKGTPAEARIEDFLAKIDRGNIDMNVDRIVSTLESRGKASVVSSDFTWHHHQDTGRMQLIPKDIHKITGHVGGDLRLHVNTGGKK